MPEGSENFNREIDGREAEEWFQRHDRGEITINHLIMEKNGVWRIKGQLHPHKVLPPSPGPHKSPVGRAIFSADADEDLKALEREAVARLGVGSDYRPAERSPRKAQGSPSKAHKAPSKPASAVRERTQGDLFRDKIRLSDWLK